MSLPVSRTSELVRGSITCILLYVAFAETCCVLPQNVPDIVE